MKIAIVGAAGNAGSRITAEAIMRRHAVVAIGPTSAKLNELPRVTPIQGNLAEPSSLAGVVADCDVLVSAVRFVRFRPDDLIGLARTSGVKRLLVVGGAGSLKVAHGLLMNQPGFPEAARAEAQAGFELLEALRATSDVSWTMICPSAQFMPGERTGAYRIGRDELLTGPDGRSRISMEDFAIAVVDEIERGDHRGQRFTVGY
jgi:putative NADH-flavin reductase